LGPSRPSREELSILKSQVDACAREVAESLRRADVLLLCAGAGFSADSGLPIYQDIANVKAYQDLGYKYHDICRPEWLSHDPEIFYGFWGTCFNDYRQTQPHEGYAIIRKWRDARFGASSRVARAIRMQLEEVNQQAPAPAVPPPYKVTGAAGAFFVYTSNVDGHSFDYFEPEEVRECHGNTEVWQCGCLPPCCKQTWRAPEDFKFVVDTKTMRAPVKQSAGPQETEASDPAEDTGDGTARVGRVNRPFGVRQKPLATLPKENRKEVAKLVATSFGRKDANWPACPFCNTLCRPRVLMFNDTHMVSDTEQDARFQRWREVLVDVGRSLNVSHGRMMRVVILEIGCGGTVPTVRMTCEATAVQLKSAADVTVARINPDFPLPDRLHPPSMYLRYLSLPMRGLEGLKKVNEQYTELTKPRARRRPQVEEEAAALDVARSRSPKKDPEAKNKEKEEQDEKDAKEETKEDEEDSEEESSSSDPEPPRRAPKAKAKQKAAAAPTRRSYRVGRLSPQPARRKAGADAGPARAAPKASTPRSKRKTPEVIRTLD